MTTKSKIQCNKCKEVKGVRPDVFDQRVKRFSSVAKLLEQYLCWKCRPKKKNMSIEDKVKSMNRSNPTISYSEIGKRLGVDRHKVSKIINS